MTSSTRLLPRPSVPGDCRIGICFHGIGPQRRALESDEAGYWVGRDQFLAILDEIMQWPQGRSELRRRQPLRPRDRLARVARTRVERGVLRLGGTAGRCGEPGAEDLRTLVDAGMDVGTHGWRHVPWTDLADHELWLELTKARAVLGETMDRPVDKAALPLGRYNRRVLRHLRRAGYVSVSTSDRTIAYRGRWLQPRFSIHATDTPETLRAVVGEATLPWRRMAGSAKATVKSLR